MNKFISEFFKDADVEMQFFEFEVQDMMKGMDKSGDFLISRDELRKFMMSFMGIRNQMA